MKILIVKTSSIGDVVHTLPALNALRRRFPSARITWLVEEVSSGIVTDHRALDRVFICGRKQWIKDLKRGRVIYALKQIRSFIRMLRADRYDIVIDFQGLLKSAIWVLLARGKRKIGYGRGMEHSEHSYVVLNEKIPVLSMEGHAIDRVMMLAAAAGAPVDEIRFDFPVRDSDRRKTDALLKACGIGPGDRIVTVNPVARWKTKLWDDDLFAEAADRIAEKGFKVCFTGAESDRCQVDGIISMMKRPAANLCGKTSLKELAALYERSEALVTTDTGPMHIAAAAGAPTVALFGPTAPWRTGPYGAGHRIVRARTHCSPCFKRDCPTVECMKKITPDMVMENLEALLKPGK